jgi:hypothetical protein
MSISRAVCFTVLSRFVSLANEYLQTASRLLTIDELQQHARDNFLLSHEFWVCLIMIDKSSDDVRLLYYFQSIPTNHLDRLRICGAGIKNRYGTIIASR